MEMVLDSLTEKSVIINKRVLHSFQRFTELTERLQTRNKSQRKETKLESFKQINQVNEGPLDDFREIAIFPQTEDMQVPVGQYLQANKIKGKYDNLNHYLDVQFRLLREDFVGPLREGINEYIQARGTSKQLQDIRIYYDVQLVTPICSLNGILYELQFDVSRVGRVKWGSTKRLIYGSLLCLSPDNFETLYLATVVERKPELLKRGIVTVKFENENTMIRALFGRIFIMAETTAYFEAYRHVLSGLKNFRNGDMPFENYIIRCENEVAAPAYLRRNPEITFDLRCLFDDKIALHGKYAKRKDITLSLLLRSKGRDVKILDLASWPTADLLNLDDSQYMAIQTALTKEFAVIQGPPGTGKTYIGLKIVKALLHNKDAWSIHPETHRMDKRPILIVCYTNHALDQFLEGIVKFYKSDVLRIGSRCNSEVLKELNLRNVRQKFRKDKMFPLCLHKERRDARNAMDTFSRCVEGYDVYLQNAMSTILHENCLEPFMERRHYNMLNFQYQRMIARCSDASLKRSFIKEWLGVGESVLVDELPQYQYSYHEKTEEMIGVKDNIDFIQEQRILENDEMDEIEIETKGKAYSKTETINSVTSNTEKLKALDVSMGKNLEEEKIDDWESQKNQKKKMRRNIKKHLHSNDVMPDDEALQIHDLMQMTMQDKWRLYRLWRKRYRDHYLTKMSRYQYEYEEAVQRHKKALLREDEQIMLSSTVIGMTTTGAARYQSVLKEVRPRIVVVEEAAEVLEAHIITALSRGCEHLILIGDHKQLKPSPTVYKLATDYNLDVSLFERMVNNQMRCDCLELQHRMRPEIAQLMRHIYDNYRDHEDVKTYENVKGISQNIYFINHTEPERHNEDSKSYSNVFEAEYIMALCRYLLKQGYNPEQITVLTTYSGQLFVLKSLMPKSDFEGVCVTVVDNYQGEENDIILLSLVRSNEAGTTGFLKIENRVCVALSRAKKGLYVIGNFNMLSGCKIWRAIVSDMKKRKLFGDGLLLYCQNHPNDIGIVAKNGKDFDRAPEGGCRKLCDVRLKCGHVCPLFCHILDNDHKDFLCQKLCNKITCSLGHRCRQKCHEECGNCKTIVEKVIPQCGHAQIVLCSVNPEDYVCKMKCNKVLSCGHPCKAVCGSAHTSACKFIVDKAWPCGHTGKVLCHEKRYSSCPEPCNSVLECMHKCKGTCKGCFGGRLHKACQEPCKKILVCGHQCTSPCNICRPCKRSCQVRCGHRRCVKPCGEICKPCIQPCLWRCEHYKCNKLCSEPCDRPRCNRACKNILLCGHPCIGLCGEPCPSDCRQCNRERVTKILFGDEEKPDARFVLLQDCPTKCIIESKAMDKYMDTLQDTSQETILKRCPKCKTRIWHCNRYGSIINKTLKTLEDAKKNLLRDKEKVHRLKKI